MQEIISGLSLANFTGIALAAIPAIINLGLIFYLIFFMPQNRLTIVFTIFVFGLFIWQLADVSERASTSPEVAGFWGSVLSTGWIFVPALAAHFCILYTGRYRVISNAGIFALLYVPTLVFSSVYKTTAIDREYVFRGIWGWNPEFYSLMDDIMLAWLSLLGLFALFLLMRYTYRNRNNQRLFLQSLFITVGLAVPTLQAILTEVVFPLILHIPVVSVTSTTMSFFALAVVIALKKYDLFSVSSYLNAEAMLHRISDIIVTFSPQGSLTYVNTYAAEVLGVNESAPKIYHLKDFFPEDGHTLNDFEDKVWNKVLEGQNISDYQTTLKNTHGRLVSVLLNADPVSGPRNLNAVLLVARDITELRSAQDEIAINEKRYRALIEKSTDCIVTIGKDAIIQYATPAVVDVLGYDLDEYIGMDMFKIIHPESTNDVAEAFKDILSEPGLSRTTVLKAIHKSGRVIWLEGTGTNLLDEPAIEAIVGNFRDVTLRHEAEEKLRQQNEELIRVNNELDHFIYSVSHDIKAPLKSVLGITQLAESETTDENMQQYFGMIRQSTERLNDFALEIIEFSKDTRQEVRIEEVNINELTDEVMENIKYLEDAGKIDIQVEIKGDDIFRTDKSKLFNIITNLLSNAIKYHNLNQEHPFIRLSYTDLVDKVIIRVTDNGEGIAKAHYEKIFNMFQRMSSKSYGSGLGLYIVKETLKKLRGTISLHSELGKGTEFEIVLPKIL